MRDTVRALVRDLSTELVSQLLRDLNRALSSLCSSQNQHERLGAVLVIYELADVQLRDASEQLIRSANYLR